MAIDDQARALLQIMTTNVDTFMESLEKLKVQIEISNSRGYFDDTAPTIDPTELAADPEYGYLSATALKAVIQNLQQLGTLLDEDLGAGETRRKNFHRVRKQ